MAEGRSGIYVITNTENGKAYIGSTVDFKGMYICVVCNKTITIMFIFSAPGINMVKKHLNLMFWST